MQMSNELWGIICAVASIAVGILGYFIKGLVTKPEKHEDAIHDIHLKFASKEDVERHGEAINHIKQTYVTKDEMKEMRRELNSKTEKLSSGIEEIKANYLTRDDYYRTHVEINRKIDFLQQTLIERLDKIGGTGNGR